MPVGCGICGEEGQMENVIVVFRFPLDIIGPYYADNVRITCITLAAFIEHVQEILPQGEKRIDVLANTRDDLVRKMIDSVISVSRLVCWKSGLRVLLHFSSCEHNLVQNTLLPQCCHSVGRERGRNYRA
eukprot:2531137-Rhodomonas_salina.1